MNKCSSKQLVVVILATMFIAVAGCIGKADEEKIALKEYFELLPPDVLPEHISRDKCLEQLQLIEQYHQGWSDLGPIRIYDEENGYMCLSETEFDWILMHRRLQNDKKMLLVNSNEEDGSHIRIFFYDNGKLIEDTKNKPYADVVYAVEDFVEFSELSDEAIEMANNLFNNNMYKIYYHLPEKGDTISVAAQFEDSRDYENEYVDEINFDAFKFCTLIWVDDKWIKK